MIHFMLIVNIVGIGLFLLILILIIICKTVYSVLKSKSVTPISRFSAYIISLLSVNRCLYDIT